MKYYRCYYWDGEKYPDFTRIIWKTTEEEVVWEFWDNLEQWLPINNWSTEKNKLFFKKEWTNRDYISNSIIEPTISTKLKNLLIKEWLVVENKDVQFLPITIEQEWNPNNKIEGYFICNILNMTEWMVNEEKAITDPWWYTKMAFKKEVDDLGLHIFRPAEYRVAFYISEKVKEIFDREDLKIDLNYTEIEVG